MSAETQACLNLGPVCNPFFWGRCACSYWALYCCLVLGMHDVLMWPHCGAWGGVVKRLLHGPPEHLFLR